MRRSWACRAAGRRRNDVDLAPLGDVPAELAFCFATGNTARAGDRGALSNEPDHGLENEMPNHLLVNEPSLSVQGIGGKCGR